VAKVSARAARDVGLELTLPWEAGAPLKATFTTGWVTYRTWLRPARPLRVYPLAPLKLGVLELGRYTPLEYLGLEGRRMRARPVLDGEWRPVRPLELTLSCEETAITSGRKSWDDDADASDGGTRRSVALPAEQDLPLSATPGGPPEGVLRLKPSALARVVPVLEEQGDAVRVRVSVWPARVTGWMPKQLASPQENASDIFGALGGIMGREVSDGAGKPSWPRCGTGVPLYLVRGGALEPAGELRPNAAYEVKQETAGWTEIALPENAWLELEPGLSWALKPGDLAVCRTKSAPAQ
jgi:hypothetical protein